jgi:hypothetical protein
VIAYYDPMEWTLKNSIPFLKKNRKFEIASLWAKLTQLRTFSFIDRLGENKMIAIITTLHDEFISISSAQDFISVGLYLLQ